MQKIMCMDGEIMKEYKLTYDSREMVSFLSSLNTRIILPSKVPEIHDISKAMIYLYGIIYETNYFDSCNTLLTYEDITAYIRKLHRSNSLDLTPLYVLVNSNGAMRNVEVYSLFCEFFNLYTYQELFRYDGYYTSALLRKEYEYNPNASILDCEVMKKNAIALSEIGFSIESKIQNHGHQKKYQ